MICADTERNGVTMTLDELEAKFSAANDEEYIQFDRVKNKRSARADLHAFLLLDELQPHIAGDGNGDMVSAAEHDEFYLCIDTEKLAEVITDEQIIELVRCGVMYSEASLMMFA